MRVQTFGIMQLERSMCIIQRKESMEACQRYFELHSGPCGSQDTLCDMVNKLWIGQPREGLISGVGVSVFRLFHNVQTGSEILSAS